MISYATIRDASLKNLEMDGTQAENEARFNILENVNSAFRTIAAQAPKAILKSSAKLFTQDLLVTGKHEIQPDQYIRIVEVYVDYDNTSVPANGFIKGLRAVERHYIFDDYLGKSKLQPVYENRKDLAGKQIITIAPLPTEEVTKGLSLLAVEAVDIDASNACPLDISLKDAIVFLVTHLAAMTDGYNLKLAQEYEKKYQGVVESWMQ